MLFDANTKQFIRGGKISDKKMKDASVKSLAATTSSFAPNKQARQVAYSEKHGHVVVCNNLKKVSVRQFDDLDKKVCSLKHAQKYCQVAVYSPCENFLALGSHDNHMYIYAIDAETHEYKLHAKDARNHAWINAIDWTLDSNTIRTSSGDYETLYFDVANKEGDSHGSTTAKDKDWASNTILYGEDRHGCKPSSEDNTHLNSIVSNKINTLMLTGDDFGLVNVFNFPEPSTEASRSFAGHSEHVPRLVMSKDN